MFRMRAMLKPVFREMLRPVFREMLRSTCKDKFKVLIRILFMSIVNYMSTPEHHALVS